jgi:hypothetical protein
MKAQLKIQFNTCKTRLNYAVLSASTISSTALWIYIAGLGGIVEPQSDNRGGRTYKAVEALMRDRRRIRA